MTIIPVLHATTEQLERSDRTARFRKWHQRKAQKH